MSEDKPYSFVYTYEKKRGDYEDNEEYYMQEVEVITE